jgi:predicted RNA-binding Zn-ribbon protein involved in translation (DUF1610 family)
MYKCPDCGSTALDVTITTMARLVQDEDGPQTLTDEAQQCDHEWDENSAMMCRDCGHNDIAQEFECDDDNKEEESDNE